MRGILRWTDHSRSWILISCLILINRARKKKKLKKPKSSFIHAFALRMTILRASMTLKKLLHALHVLPFSMNPNSVIMNNKRCQFGFR